MADRAPGTVDLGEVTTHLEALNLTGLSFAVRRLLGKDPQPVTGQFTMWARQGHKGLPGLTQAYWTALAPLRVGRPPSPAAAVCDQVLRGRERDGSVALEAAADCASGGRARFRPLPEVAAGDLDASRRDDLVAAVKDWWRTVGTLYGEVRGPVVAGDLQTAVGRVRKAAPVLGEIVERVAALAAEVAAAQGVDPSAPTPDAVSDLDPKAVAAQATAAMALDDVADPPPPRHPMDAWAAAQQGGMVDATGPLRRTGPLGRRPDDDPSVPDPVDARAAAFANQRRLREERAASPTPPRPVEVLSTRPVRNHVILPVLFLLVIAGVALYVIFSVLNAPNPLAP